MGNDCVAFDARANSMYVGANSMYVGSEMCGGMESRAQDDVMAAIPVECTQLSTTHHGSVTAIVCHKRASSPRGALPDKCAMTSIC